MSEGLTEQKLNQISDQLTTILEAINSGNQVLIENIKPIKNSVDQLADKSDIASLTQQGTDQLATLLNKMSELSSNDFISQEFQIVNSKIDGNTTLIESVSLDLVNLEGYFDNCRTDFQTVSSLLDAEIKEFTKLVDSFPTLITQCITAIVELKSTINLQIAELIANSMTLDSTAKETKSVLNEGSQVVNAITSGVSTLESNIGVINEKVETLNSKLVDLANLSTSILAAAELDSAITQYSEIANNATNSLLNLKKFVERAPTQI